MGVNNLCEEHSRAIVIFCILLVSISLVSALIINIRNNHAIEQKAYHDAIRVTTKNEFDHALTGNHTILVTTKLAAKDPVTSDQYLDKDNLIYYEKSHLYTTTVMVPMSDGKNTTMIPQTQTQVVEDDARTAKSVVIFDHSYSTDDFKISKLKQTKSVGDYDYEFVPNGKTVTFLAQTKDGKLSPISNSKKIKLYPYTQKQFDDYIKNR